MKKTFTILIAAIAAILMMAQSYPTMGQTRGSASNNKLSSKTTNDQIVETGKPIYYKCSSSNSYENPARIYKNNKLTIKSNDGSLITSIELTTSSSDYPGSNFSANVGSYTYSTSTSKGTWEGSATSIEFTATGGQVRVNAVTVTYSSATNYTVTISNTIANGSVTASPTSAAQNTTIELTPSANSDYKLTGWSITKTSDGTESDITPSGPNAQGKYTFSMPAYNVTVGATFSQTYAVTCATVLANGSIEADMATAVENEIVTITATPSSGYKLSTITVTKEGGGTLDAGDIDIEGNVAMFEMPADNVTVSATFEEYFTVTYNDNGATSGSVPTDENQYSSGDKVTVLGNTGSLEKTGNTFEGWNTKSDLSGTKYVEDNKFEISSNTNLYAHWTVNTYNVALSGVANVTLTASYDDGGEEELGEGEDADIHYGTEITLNAAELAPGKVFIWNVKKQSDNSDVTSDVLDGDILTVPAYAITISGQVVELFFQYSGELTEGDYIIYYSGKAMKNEVSGNYIYYSSVTPSAGEILIASASDITWHLAKSGDYWTIKNGSNYAASTGAANKAQLLTDGTDDKSLWSASGTSTYEFVNKQNTTNKVNANLRENTTYGYACYSTGTGGALTLFKKVTGGKHSVAKDGSISNGNIGLSTTSAYAGQSVILTAEPNDGYLLNEWSVYKTGDASTKVTVKNNAFVMPDYNVTVSATFRVAHTYSLVTSTNNIIPGKHYVIAAAKSGATSYNVAMSTQNAASYRNYVDISATDFSDDIISEINGLCEVVLSGDNTNKWTIYDVSSEKYLVGGDKALTSNGEISNAAKWSISIDGSSNIATITNTATGLTDYTIQYNSNNPRFACYSSSQRSIYLYKKDDDNDCHIYSATNLNDFTVSGNMNIHSGVVTVAADKTLTVTGELTNTTASNLVINDGGQLKTSSSGVKATFRKSIEKTTETAGVADNAHWYAISSPVSTAASGLEISSVENFVDSDDDDFKYNLFRYNESAAAQWEAYNEDEHDDFVTLEKGRGYLYRNNTDNGIEFIGTVNTDEVKITLTASAEGKLKGFNLIGNPFAEDITMSNITGKSFSGGYILSNGSAWNPSIQTTISPCQGFLVQVDAEETITITKPVSAKGNTYNQEYLQFIVANSEYEDIAYALFDKGYGLNKINHRNADVPMLFIPQNGQDYAIATMSDDTKSFNLNFKAMTTGKYTLSYKAIGEYNYLHIFDRLTGADVDMLLDGEYSFIGTPNDSENRFIVRLEYMPNYSEGNDEIFAFQNGNDILVSGKGELQIFDVTGRSVMTTTISGAESINLSAQGVYIFRLVGSEIKTQKIVVR